MTERLLIQLQSKYPLTPCVRELCGTVKANGMTFAVRAYEAKGLGHVSVMRAKGMLGLMRIETLIVDPFERDLPLYSLDRIRALGNDTVYLELYDTMLQPFDGAPLAAVKTQYADLRDHDPGKHWYDDIRLPESAFKKGKRRDAARFDALIEAHFAAYLQPDAPVCDPDEKRKKASVYVEGLLSRGGPAADGFKKTLGREKTETLFRKVLFGTER